MNNSIIKKKKKYENKPENLFKNSYKEGNIDFNIKKKKNNK